MSNDIRKPVAEPAEPAKASGLRRWSQRKTQVQTRAEAPEPDADMAAVAADNADNADNSDNSDNSVAETARSERIEQLDELTDEDMPALESLDEKSDLSPFFSPKVSAGLRRLALRKIFHLPVYNIRDGLNDYDEDYTVFEPLGDIVTADMKHMREVAEKRRLEQEQLAQKQAEQLSEDIEDITETIDEPAGDEPAHDEFAQAQDAGDEKHRPAEDQVSEKADDNSDDESEKSS